MADAEVTTLGSLAAQGRLLVNDGYRTKKSELDAAGVPILRVAEVRDGYLTPSLQDRVSEAHRQKFGSKTSAPNDVVVTTKGTVGRVAMIRPTDPEFVYSPQVCFFRCLDRSVEPRFLYYWFSGSEFRVQATGVKSQTDMADYINLADVRSLRITLPSPHEQRAIADVLGALDDKIESNRRRAEIAESLLDMLAIAAAGPDLVPLGELVQVDRTSCTPASVGGTLVDHFSLPAFDADRLPDRTAGESIKSNKQVVASESVLVSRLNPGTNRTWFSVPEPGVMAAASTEFMVLRPGSRVGLGGLWLAVRDEFFRSELARRATGTSGSHQRVRPDDALSIEVPDVRGLDAAQNAEAEGMLRLVHQARAESATLADLRDALLPELLSGRLRVPIAENLVGAAT